MSNTKYTALIVGGNGIVGKSLTQYLTTQPNWEVIVTSKSALHYQTSASYLALDLSTPIDVTAHKTSLEKVTHVFFAAYTPRENAYEQVTANMQLLENVINGVEAVAPKLQRVLFIQGGKAYGAHLGYYKTPALETDARSITPNFYYNQEDFLRERSKNKSWDWTAIRPDIIIGVTVKNAMNMGNLIATYATLCKAEGIPMRFPGSEKAYNALVNVTDATVLAKSMQWAAETKETANQIFNITNGDVFRWSQLWSAFGAHFGVAVAEPQTFSLQEYMQGKNTLWQQLVAKHNLQPYKLNELVQWNFGDFIFNVTTDAFQDVNKARSYGFHHMNGQTLTLFKNTFNQLKEEKLIP